MALAYKGLEAESVLIEYSDRTLVQQVSGQGLVPVLEEDGVVVHDSHAILRHLEERHPDAPLFPPGPAQQAELDVFLEWFDHVWKIAPKAIEAELGNTPPDAGRRTPVASRSSRATCNATSTCSSSCSPAATTSWATRSRLLTLLPSLF